MDVIDQRYGAAYYASGLGPDPYCRNDRWLAFFNGVAREIVLALAPRRVFDAGCAMGMLVESLWDLGVEAHGVDISSYAIAQVRPDMRPYCRVGSVTEAPEGRYDLVTCIEVLEHIDAADAERAVAALADATDTILFSSTPSDFEEPTHVNVRPPIAWIRAFAEHGFRVDLRFDASFLSPQAMLLRRVERYPDETVEGLYAHHVLIRSALIEREQRIGRLRAQAEGAAARARAELESLRAAHEAEFETVRTEHEAELESLRAAHEAEFETFRTGHEAELEAVRLAHEAELAAGRRESAAARAALERTQDETAAVAARAAAERNALAVLHGRLAEAHAELDAARARAEAAAAGRAEAERRTGAAEDRAALALLRLGERDAPKRDPDDPGVVAELARRYAVLEARYRRVVADDVALFEAEASRLSGY